LVLAAGSGAGSAVFDFIGMFILVHEECQVTWF